VHLNGAGRNIQDTKQPWGRFSFTNRHWNFLAHHMKNDLEAPSLGFPITRYVNSDHTQLEVQTNWDFASGDVRLVAGVAYDKRRADSVDPSSGMQTLFRQAVDYDREAVFGQVDWRVNEHLKLVGAGRWENSTFHDGKIMPKAAVIYNINPKQTLRFTYKEAFRENDLLGAFLELTVGLNDLSQYEQICVDAGVSCGLGLAPRLAVGNENLELEENQTFEIGYIGVLGRKAFLTADLYFTKNDNFLATNLLPQVGTPLGRLNEDFGPWEPPPGVPDDVRDAVRAAAEADLLPLGSELSNASDGSNAVVALSFTSFGRVDTVGLDLGLTYYFSGKWSAFTTYSWFDFDIKEDDGLDDLLVPNTPEHRASAGVTYANKRLDVSLSGRWVDEFRWIGGQNVGDVKSYAVADLNANYRLAKHWKVGVNIANLFDNDHWELWAGSLVGRRALVHVTFSW
jgi:iron complex outermembrane receptor protein